MKNTMAMSRANTLKVAALPAAMGRDRNRRSGTMGSAARSSQPTKAAPSTIPAASAAAISGLVQPRLLARISAQTMPRALVAASSSPMGSRLARRGQRQHPGLGACQARTVCTHVSSSWSVTGSDTGLDGG